MKTGFYIIVFLYFLNLNNIVFLYFLNLNNTRLKHWCLFVHSLYILLKTNITREELARADEMLHLFVSQVEELYSLRAMTYNCHQLLHIVKSVEDWGPLVGHFCFPFESKNGTLLKAIHNAKGVIFQILRKENIKHYIVAVKRFVDPTSSEVFQELYDDIESYHKVRKCIKINKVTYFGKSSYIISDDVIKKYNLSRSAKYYKKIVKDKCLYRTSEKQNPRSCNYYAQIGEKMVKIINFIVDEEKRIELVVFKELNTVPYASFEKLHKIICETDQISSVETDLLYRVCVLIETNKNSYLCPVPNLYYY